MRDRKNTGLIYVVPNAEPEAEEEQEVVGGEGQVALVGDSDVSEPSGNAAVLVEAEEQATASEPPEAVGRLDSDEAEGGGEEAFELEPGAELEVLRQLGADIDAPTLPGSRIHALKQATTIQVERPVPRDQLDRIALNFEQEWQRLQKHGIRHYIPPELRDLYDAIPSASELAEIVKSLLPGSGEAQSLLEYNEATNRFFERLGAGDVAGAQQAAADTLNESVGLEIVSTLAEIFRPASKIARGVDLGLSAIGLADSISTSVAQKHIGRLVNEAIHRKFLVVDQRALKGSGL